MSDSDDEELESRGPVSTRRARRVRPTSAADQQQQQNQPKKRDRKSEGDIAVTARGLERMINIDVHIISSLVPSRLNLCTGIKIRQQTEKNIVCNDMKVAENWKRHHYKALAMKMANATQKQKISLNDPLAPFHIEFVPAVMSPFGNMGEDLQALLRRLTIIATASTQSNAPIGSDTNNNTNTVSQSQLLSKFKAILAAAMARAVAETFSRKPQRINVD